MNSKPRSMLGAQQVALPACTKGSWTVGSGRWSPKDKCRQWVGSTHSLTVRPDIRGHRYANGRKATYSRLTDAVTSTSAMAEDPSTYDWANGRCTAASAA